MPSWQKKEKFQQLAVFKRGRIIGLRKGGFSCCTMAARVQWNSFIVMQVWKQWTDEQRTARKTRRSKLTSKRNHRHLFRMTVNNHTASSRQLAGRWSTTTGELMSLSSICQRCIVDCVQRCLYTGSPSRQTIDG